MKCPKCKTTDLIYQPSQVHYWCKLCKIFWSLVDLKKEMSAK